MHIAFVLHVYDHYEQAQQMLDAFFTTSDWANALHKEGIKVSVFYRFHSNHLLHINGVHYHFIKDNLPPRLKHWHSAKTFNESVAKIAREEKIDLVHAHNPYGILPNAHLRKLLSHIPMLVQDHSGKPTVKYAPLLRYFLKDMDAILFAAKGQEKVYLEHGILSPEKYHFVMENSSHFRYESRTKARQKTNFQGNPIFLWVGNLNANKDPFTALKSFEQIAEKHPNARLYMIYRFNDLEQEVRAVIAQSKVLAERVEMLGAKERNDLGDYYNSADYFISASYKEGSGYAMIEAISCGVIPIATNIPSFESLTHNGAIGGLFTPGDSEQLTQEILTLMERPIEEESQKVFSHFKAHFSFEAIAKQTIKIYEKLLTNSKYA